MKIQVREGTAADQDFIVQAQLSMAFETEALRLDPSTVRKGVGAVFADPHRGQYFIAEAENHKRVGCLLTVPEWSDWRNGTVLWIHSVYVVPEMRKQGVYRELYALLRNQVEASVELRGLRLYVERKNSAAQAVYENLGMTKEHYELYEWLKS